MAYDPNDAADKKLVGKLIKDAVDAALVEAASEHEADVVGLKKKNVDLLKKLKDGGGDQEQVLKLENDLEKAKEDAKNLRKNLKTAETDRDAFKVSSETETAASRRLLVDQGLTDSLLKVNVAPQFMPAVKKLLEGKVQIKAEGDNRIAVVDDKPLGEFVKTWSQGDEGKHYIAARPNGGGNAPGGQAGGGDGKSLARPAFNALSPLEQSTFAKQGGRITE